MNQKLIAKSNYVLRKVLQKKENLFILKDFIESILEIKIKDIKLRPYLEKVSKYLPSEENFGVGDVRIKTEENKEFNIGIQFIDGYYIQNKMLLYYAQIHNNQLEYGDGIASTITINILHTKYLKSEKYHSIVKINNENQEELELHVIELPKLKKICNQIKNKKDAWVAYLEGTNEQLVEQAKQYKSVKDLENAVDEYWKEEKME